jgi:sensor histidine kinase YesM
MKNSKKPSGRGTLQSYLMILSLTTTILISGILGVIYYGKVNTFLQDKRETLITMKMEQVSQELNEQLHDVYQTLTALNTNENVIKYLNRLSDDDITGTEKYRTGKDLERYLYVLTEENRLIGNILLITSKTQYSGNSDYISFDYNGISVKNSVEDQYNLLSINEASEDYFNLSKTAEKSEIINDDFSELSAQPFFTSNMHDLAKNNDTAIFIFLDINHFMESSFDADHFALTDGNNDLIFNSKNNPFKTMQQNHDNTDEKESMALYQNRIPLFGWNLYYMGNTESLKSQQISIWGTIMLSIIIALFMVFVFSKWISGKILQPIYDLLLAIKKGQSPGKQIQSKGSRKQGNLRERLFFYFLITIVGPISIFVLLYFWQSSKIIMKEIRESEYQIHLNQAHLLKREINEKKLTLSRLSMDPDFSIDVGKQNAKAIEEKMLTEKKYALMESDHIAVYNHGNNLMYSNRTNTKKHLSKHFLRALNNEHQQITYHVQKDNFNQSVFSMGKPIYNPENASEITGYLVIYMKGDYLNSVYDDQGENETFIIGKDNVILHAKDPAIIMDLFQPKVEKLDKAMDLHITKEGYYFVTPVQDNDWSFISNYSSVEVRKEIKQLFLSDSYFIFIVLLIAISFSYWIPIKVIKPLGRINALFDTFDIHERPKEEVSAVMIGIDELDMLQRNFHHNMEKMNRLINEQLEANQRRVEVEYENREIQMNALQSQVNPHFLYNTLDNLLYIVESEQTDKATDMIIALSRFFRFITNQEKMIVPIKEEMAYTKSYVDIMSHRFDNFYCVWEIDENLGSKQMIKLLLQPLIENAIRHGVKETSDIVQITIKCEAVDGTLQFTVKDNANGIAPKRLNEIQQILASSVLKKSGIYNVNARIKVYYGDEYGLKIASTECVGTTVTITIPDIF